MRCGSDTSDTQSDLEKRFHSLIQTLDGRPAWKCYEEQDFGIFGGHFSGGQVAIFGLLLGRKGSQI